jgi:hypothetical protein
MNFIDKWNDWDIIYAICTDNQLCYHIGIVYNDGIKKLVYHNHPEIRNKYGGTVCAENYEKFIKGRVLQKVIRTNAKNADILRIARKCRKEKWDSLFFNCEDFVLEVVEGHRRSNIRDVLKLVAIGVTTLMLLWKKGKKY